MYNHALKSSFLDTLTSVSLVEEFVELFRLCEPFERELNTDVCSFENASLIELFNQFGSDYMARDRAKTLLMRYLNYCRRSRKIPADANFDGVLTYLPTDYVYECVSGPSGLQKYLDAIFVPEKLYTIDNIYRCMFWMAFAGMDDGYVETLTTNDVDLEMSRFIANGKVYPIYNEGLFAIRNCKCLKTFNLIRTDYQTTLNRAPGDLLLRGIKSNPNLVRMRIDILHKSDLSISLGKIKKRLTYLDVRRSGVFYRVYNVEASSRPALVNPRQIITEELIKLGFESPAYTTVSEYLHCYINWKKAFR